MSGGATRPPVRPPALSARQSAPLPLNGRCGGAAGGRSRGGGGGGGRRTAASLFIDNKDEKNKAHEHFNQPLSTGDDELNKHPNIPMKQKRRRRRRRRRGMKNETRRNGK